MLGETKVTRVYTDDGRAYHHEPALDDSWSDLMRLRWWAAVVNIDIAPLRIEVKSGVGSLQVRGRTQTDVAYYVTVPGSGYGVGGKTFDQAWSYILDLSLGIQMERRRAERAAKPPVERVLNETTPIFDRLAAAAEAPAVARRILGWNHFELDHAG